MRSIAIAVIATALSAELATAQQIPPTVAPEDMHWVAPALAGFTDEVLFGEVWKRSDLTPRDRSLVTLAVLVAGGHDGQLTGHVNRALDNGVKPVEIGGLVTHVAFYAGWPRAVAALGVARAALEARGINAAEMRMPDAGLGIARMSNIMRKGAGPIVGGSATHFTGNVSVSAPFDGAGTGRLRGSTVHFEVGARTAWHKHSAGQTLIVTEGCGWTQQEGGSVERICAGDVAVIGPGVKHWHGATASSSMTHVALSDNADVEWLEPVSISEYSRGPR
ncbi:carboxymuconolactone decarboxylase family protein [Sphingomonas sp. FW199]|uniref:(R)-mandelonitrile lyase n=1 Tax=Sphingomonas sp. FW199 TaxID=3400217 RepID=UPI003CF69464